MSSLLFFKRTFLLIFIFFHGILFANKGGDLELTQGERVKLIRKSERVNLTLEKFGEKIGLKKNSVSQIENGINNLTEQMTKAICREFNVDYIWLTTGEGEMFVETDDDFMERIDRIMAGEDEARKNLFKIMLDVLNDDDIAALNGMIEKVVNHYTKTNETG